ncbi:dTDP-4-dehydrorhamnose reductase [Lunatimonas salinarum]|uniref:dTDP-4-dehydrorhamnose reductase n=1 Tax=Lunatimonas salinarum TaxID=1774590 RepID=UPI001ADF19FE|nr:dTDP-4-dehydrorhamnose reductase [Lunatimonas salinarum]
MVTKKKVLVIGKNGQLGSEIGHQAQSFLDLNFTFTSSAELDLTDSAQMVNYFSSNRYDVVINCAAYTNVEGAEASEEEARLVNAIGVKNLAELCFLNKIFLIHISTDYVFDGSTGYPINEDVTPNPLGVYGRTKLEGEQFIIVSGCDHLIFRISWLYSQFGDNFVKTIANLSASKKELKVVYDQVGTPTSSIDFSRFLLKIIEDGNYLKFQGIYHYANQGVCSWYDFAYQIVQILQHDCRVVPVLSDEYPSKVKRPNYVVLNKRKLCKHFRVEISHWNDSLRHFLTNHKGLICNNQISI